MINATYGDKHTVVDILSESFRDNMSVNYIIKQDKYWHNRIRRLMEYSFEVCLRFGRVFLSQDKKACALVLFPDKKKTTVGTILLDIRLILSCIGITGVRNALTRESKINSLHPKEPIFYLWFIGVAPEQQHQGMGSALLNELLKESAALERPVYLETSTLKNLPWYQSFGFNIYHELDLGYKLFFLKRDPAN